MALSREQMAQRVARELKDGYYVNLGIGIPTLVANYVPDDIDVMLQSENGLLGMGAFPTEDTIDADMINAGKQTVTARIGASIFFVGRILCHDPRRPCRPDGARRFRGGYRGQHRFVDDPRQADQGHGWRDGPGGGG